MVGILFRSLLHHGFFLHRVLDERVTRRFAKSEFSKGFSCFQKEVVRRKILVFSVRRDCDVNVSFSYFSAMKSLIRYKIAKLMNN